MSKVIIIKNTGATVNGTLLSCFDGEPNVATSGYSTTKGATVSDTLVKSALMGETVHKAIWLGMNPTTGESYAIDVRGIPVGLSAEIQVNIEGLDWVTVLTGEGNIGDSGYTNRDAKRFAEDWECVHREEIAEKLHSAKLLDILPSEIVKGEYTPLAKIEIAQGEWDGFHYVVEGVISAQRID